MNSNADWLDDARALADGLAIDGHGQAIRDAIEATSTGGELLMALRTALQRTLEDDAQVSETHRTVARRLLAEVNRRLP